MNVRTRWIITLIVLLSATGVHAQWSTMYERPWRSQFDRAVDVEEITEFFALNDEQVQELLVVFTEHEAVVRKLAAEGQAEVGALEAVVPTISDPSKRNAAVVAALKAEAKWAERFETENGVVLDEIRHTLTPRQNDLWDDYLRFRLWKRFANGRSILVPGAYFDLRSVVKDVEDHLSVTEIASIQSLIDQYVMHIEPVIERMIRLQIKSDREVLRNIAAASEGNERMRQGKEGRGPIGKDYDRDSRLAFMAQSDVRTLNLAYGEAIAGELSDENVAEFLEALERAVYWDAYTVRTRAQQVFEGIASRKDLTDEQRLRIEKLMAKHDSEVRPLREKLAAIDEELFLHRFWRSQKHELISASIREREKAQEALHEAGRRWADAIQEVVENVASEVSPSRSSDDTPDRDDDGGSTQSHRNTPLRHA